MKKNTEGCYIFLFTSCACSFIHTLYTDESILITLWINLLLLGFCMSMLSTISSRRLAESVYSSQSLHGLFDSSNSSGFHFETFLIGIIN